MQVSVFWDTILCRLVYRHQCFVGAWCLHLHGGTRMALNGADSYSRMSVHVSIYVVSYLRRLEYSGRRLMPRTRCVLSWKCILLMSNMRWWLPTHTGTPFLWSGRENNIFYTSWQWKRSIKLLILPHWLNSVEKIWHTDGNNEIIISRIVLNLTHSVHLLIFLYISIPHLL